MSIILETSSRRIVDLDLHQRFSEPAIRWRFEASTHHVARGLAVTVSKDDLRPRKCYPLYVCQRLGSVFAWCNIMIASPSLLARSPSISIVTNCGSYSQLLLVHCGSNLELREISSDPSPFPHVHDLAGDQSPSDGEFRSQDAGFYDR